MKVLSKLLNISLILLITTGAIISCSEPAKIQVISSNKPNPVVNKTPSQKITDSLPSSSTPASIQVQPSSSTVPVTVSSSPILAVTTIPTVPVTASDILTETTTDYLNYYQKSKSYNLVIQSGGKVINLPEEESFFVLWFPPNYKSERLMVAIHGTDGTAYEELKDEIEMGKKYDYGVIGIQWLNKSTNTYYEPDKIYKIIEKALRHVKAKYNNSLSKVATEGFSRGSAISYELAYQDLIKTKYFDLVIAHSGGIIANQLRPFFKELEKGTYGTKAFANSTFFLYCGLKDEQFGTQMCEQIKTAESIISKQGAKVVEFVNDPNGGHGGYHLNTSNHEKAINYFINLTK